MSYKKSNFAETRKPMATKEEYKAYKKALENAIRVISESHINKNLKEKAIDQLLEKLSILT